MHFTQFKVINGNLINLRQIEAVTEIIDPSTSERRFTLCFKSGNVMEMIYIDDGAKAIIERDSLCEELLKNY
jgi:hypothetical protein